MDRVRVGLTGLGAVFLLTLGVSLTFGAADRDPSSVSAPKEPGEPLAQLGVAPGSEKAPAAARQRREESPPPPPMVDEDRDAVAESPAATAAIGPLLGDTAAT